MRTKTHAIGVVGTGKNTGKTTTLIHLLDQGRKSGLKIGLAGIGYDGEEVDNLTRLPKPRIRVSQGMLIATSECCIRESGARMNILRRTGLSTSLGEVCIAEAKTDGQIIVAGPNQASGIRMVIDIFARLGVRMTLIDGSINRIIPLMEADALVFATGAARNREPQTLAAEMNAIIEIFEIPLAPHTFKAIGKSRTIAFMGRDGKPTGLDIASLHDGTDALKATRAWSRMAPMIFIPGLISQTALEELNLSRRKSLHAHTIIVPNAGHLILSAPPLRLLALLRSLGKQGIGFSVLKKIPIVAVTVNPFFPEIRMSENGYLPSTIDPGRLLSVMERTLLRPVFNLRDKESPARLFKIVWTGNASPRIQ
jgi:hypothetical protein